MNNELHIDALLPVEMAQQAEQIGMKKAALPTTNLLARSLLAGAFVALGAIFSTTVAAGANGVLPYGIIRLLIGLGFCLGLILIIVGGAECRLIWPKR
jgi:formate transporter